MIYTHEAIALKRKANPNPQRIDFSFDNNAQAEYIGEIHTQLETTIKNIVGNNAATIVVGPVGLTLLQSGKTDFKRIQGGKLYQSNIYFSEEEIEKNRIAGFEETFLVTSEVKEIGKLINSSVLLDSYLGNDDPIIVFTNNDKTVTEIFVDISTIRFY